MITVNTLTRQYGDFTAVDQISFAVNPGEILGLVGPNGAGKTTTLRCLAGIIAPSLGTVSIAGHDIQKEPVAAKAAYEHLVHGGALLLRRGRQASWAARRAASSRSDCPTEATERRNIDFTGGDSRE